MCSLFSRVLLPCLLFGLVSLLGIYSFHNNLEGYFTFDDRFAILENKDLLPSSPWGNLLIHDFWGQNIHSNSSHKSFRPVTTATFKLNYERSEKFTFEYHVVNVGLHAAVSGLVFVVAAVVLKGGKIYQAPFIAGILFATHPIHAEGVTSLVGRAEALCALFYLLSFLCYHAVLSLPARNYLLRLLALVSSLLLFYLACFSKELGITLLGILVAFEVFHFLGKRPAWSLSAALESTSRILVLLCNGVFYLYLRTYFIGEALSVGHEVFRKLENPIAFMESGIPKALTIGWTQLYYLYLLVYPVEMSCDYSFNCIPLIETEEDPRAPYVLLALAVFAIVVLKSAYNGLVKSDFRLAGGIVWMIVPFLPSSHMFISIGTMVAERLLYLPSIGYCLLVGHLVQVLFSWGSPVDQHKATESFKVDEGAAPEAEDQEREQEDESEPKKAASASRKASGSNLFKSLFQISLAVLIASWYLSILLPRNLDWESDEKLFRAALKVCPNSAKVLQNNGIMDRSEGQFAAAIAKFKRGQEIHPDYCDLDYQLGVSYLNQDFEVTLNYLRKALDCKYTQADAGKSLIQIAEQLQVSDTNVVSPLLHVYLGEVFERIGAEAYFRAKAHYRIAGTAYLKQVGQVPDAAQKSIAAFESAYRLEDPSKRCEYETIMGEIYFSLGRNRDAFFHLQLSIKCGANMGVIMGPYVRSLHAVLQEDTHLPERHVQWAEAVHLAGDPSQAVKHYQLASTMYASAFNFFDALDAAERVLKIDPKNCAALDQKIAALHQTQKDDPATAAFTKNASEMPACRDRLPEADKILKPKKSKPSEPKVE